MTKTLSAVAERQLERRANHKLAVLRHVDEVSGSVLDLVLDVVRVGRVLGLDDRTRGRVRGRLCRDRDGETAGDEGRDAQS